MKESQRASKGRVTLFCKKKHQKRLFYLLAGCMLSLSLIAQTSHTVSGVVTDTQGEPLIGASIIAKGSTTGTITDPDGKYTLTIPNGKNTLVISYLGYKPQEIEINGKMIINIKLQEQNNTLDDVVVIGYGISKKKDLTGAVANVKAEQIFVMPVTTPAEALQGRVAGLDITRGNGSAGSGVTIRLRGNRSVPTTDGSKDDLASYNSPLIIVDGMQGVSLEDIPPTDILSIDVLKDAASTAIYGARGANGVIIVTTKSGQTGKPKLSINSYFGISNVASYGKYMNTKQYVAFRMEKERGSTATAENNWLGIPKTAEDLFGSDMDKINAGNDT